MTIGGPSQLFPKTPYEVMKAGGGRKNIPMLTGVVKDEGTFALVDVFTILSALKLHDKKDFLRYDVIEDIQRILGTVEVSCSVTPLAVKSMLDMEAAANGDILKMVPGLIDVSDRNAREACSVYMTKLTLPCSSALWNASDQVKRAATSTVQQPPHAGSNVRVLVRLPW